MCKEFDVLQKENDLLKKENESLKEEKTINEKLQEKVIDLRQSLAKFVNGSENLKNILEHKRHPYDKSSIGYDKKRI
ncbi:hypothetical protein CR513_58726, partial [Mucuna pruriens]